jgi:hypothetical protein
MNNALIAGFAGGTIGRTPHLSRWRASCHAAVTHVVEACGAEVRMARLPTTIIAVTSKEQRHAPVLDRATVLGREAGATVILFDLDADMGPFESPLPTDWSGDGEEEQFGSRLDPNDLEAAGQAAMANKVQAIRSAGVNAFGWLPSKADASSLVDYATQQAADLVVVSTEDTELLEALRSPRGRRTDEERQPAKATGIRVEAVSPGA